MSYEKSLFFIIKDKGQINFYLYSRDLYSRDLHWLEVVWLHAPAMPASPQLHSRTGLSILNITDIFVSGALFLLFKDSFAVFDLLFFSNSMPGLWSLTRNLFAIMLISHLPYMNLDEYMCVSIYMCVCVCTYVCVYIYMSLWVCVCVCSSLFLFFCTGYFQYLKCHFLSSHWIYPLPHHSAKAIYFLPLLYSLYSLRVLYLPLL